VYAKKILNFFISERIPEGERKAAEYLVAATFVSTASTLINISVLYLLHLDRVAPISLFTLAGMVLALITVKYFAAVTLAVYLLISCVIVAVSGVAIAEGGLLNTYIFWLSMVPLGVSLVLDFKHGLISALGCCVAVFIVHIAHIGPFSNQELANIPAFKNLGFVVLLSEIGFSLALTLLYKNQKASMYNQLAERNESIENIVNNVQSGFLMIGPDLKVKPGYSLSCLNLFKKSDIVGEDLSNLLTENPNQAGHIRSCLRQVFDDQLPEDVALTNLPSSYSLSGIVHLTVEGKIVRAKSGSILTMLFTINDVTKLMEAETKNRKNEVLLDILRNKDGFLSMLRETHEAILTLESKTPGPVTVQSLRLLHTMKGNLASFGLVEAARSIHDLEGKSFLDNKDLLLLRTSINLFLIENIDVILVRSLEEVQEAVYPVTQLDLLQLKEFTKNQLGPNHPAYCQLIREFTRLEQMPLSPFLRPLETQLQRIANSIGKPARLELQGGEIKVGLHVVKFMRHLPNLLRNALYHSIEEERDREGKPWPPSLRLTVTEQEDSIVFELKDDGRGINPQIIRKKAQAMKLMSDKDLASKQDEEILQLIFADGFTTAAQVDEIAGRGSALSALKADIEWLGGKVSVKSEVGVGTRIIMLIPRVISRSSDQSAA